VEQTSPFSRHSREGGNPGFLSLKDNGFPITTSGMTIISFFQEPICKAIYETVQQHINIKGFHAFTLFASLFLLDSRLRGNDSFHTKLK
jgi:hypothetical protein